MVDGEPAQAPLVDRRGGEGRVDEFAEREAVKSDDGPVRVAPPAIDRTITVPVPDDRIKGGAPCFGWPAGRRANRPKGTEERLAGEVLGCLRGTGQPRGILTPMN
ncbi:hypothetical protein GCM10010149_75970 [Nonomuraea roseoviolacea subsp. roseoviolacea]